MDIARKSCLKKKTKKGLTKKRGVAGTWYLYLLQDKAPSHKAQFVQLTAKDFNTEILRTHLILLLYFHLTVFFSYI